MFANILQANKECEKAVLKVSSDGLATISFNIDDYKSEYFLVATQQVTQMYLEYFDKFKGMTPYLEIGEEEWSYIKETFEKLTSLKQALKCHPIKLRKQRRDIHNKIDLNKWLKKVDPIVNNDATEPISVDELRTLRNSSDKIASLIKRYGHKEQQNTIKEKY